jgi:[protein-PII] uridylyltransferase
LIKELPSYEVLFLATLLHDIGKAVRGKDHARRGAEMALGILARLGLPPADVDEVSRLVQEHLTMYLIAMRRDVEDRRTVSEFAQRVQGRAGLCSLYLLTIADLCTTSPTSMTRWKGSMLESLFRATDRLLGGDSPLESELIQRLRADAALHWDSRLPVRFLQDFFDTMPERYLLTSTSAEIAAHAKVALEVHGEAVTAALVPSRHPDVAELCVVTEGKPAKDDAGLCVVAGDRPGLLAAIAAALAANRLDIYAAQIHSRKLANGAMQAVDLFWVRDRIEGASGVESALPKLQRDLRNVITGVVNPRALLSTRKPPRWSVRPSPKVSTEVTIDNDAAPAHTVIEVFAKDQAGVLFAIAQALNDLGLTIAVAKVNTEGERAADVFYVTEADGRKLGSQERENEVRQALLSALEPVTALYEGQA